ncbi:MAG: glycosyltransferase [Pseudomonas sp.]
MLERLGAELGEELLPATEDNPKGFFENIKVVSAQEQLFTSLGRYWHDPRPLPKDWRDSMASAEAREALEKVVRGLTANARVVAIKDPRSSRIAPLWRDVSQATGVRLVAVVMVRHPLEVAESLRRRDNFSVVRANLLWMRYILDAERDTRGWPRLFIAYDHLLKDWRAEAERIEASLALPLSRIKRNAEGGLDVFLDSSLRNHKVASGDYDQSPVEALSLELYTLLMRCIGGEVVDAQDHFDNLSQRFETVAAPYLDAVNDAVGVELPLRLKQEMQSRGILQGRIDASRQLVALRELWRPQKVQGSPGECQLYFRSNGEEFVEARSVVASPQWRDGALEVELSVPAHTNSDFLRIDPDHAPGSYTLIEIAVAGQVLRDLCTRVTRVNEITLPITARGEAVRFASVGEDPYFELDMRGAWPHSRPHDSIEIKVRFRKDTVASEIGVQIGLQQREVAESVESLSQGQQQLLSWLEASRVRHEKVTAELAAVRHELALGQQQRLSLLEASRVRHEDVTAQLAAVRHELDLGQQQRLSLLEASRVRQEDVTAQLAAVRHELDLGHQQRLSLLEASRVRHEDVTAELAAVRQELDIGQRQRLTLMQASQERNEALTSELRALGLLVLGRFGELDNKQSQLLDWARRRSPRYWWGRLTKNRQMPVAQRALSSGVEVSALANIGEVLRPEGGLTWKAENDDPQLLLGGENCELSAGWYLFEASFSEMDEPVKLPCLYPDYGNGVYESDRVPLPEPRDDGHLQAVVLLKHPVRRLRFDPSIRASEFALGSVALHRIGRAEALGRMTIGAARANGSWRHAWKMLLSTLREAASGRRRRAGELAYTNYIGSHRASADSYANWVKSFDTLGPADIERMVMSVEAMIEKPLISIVMPVYQTPERWLRRCIESVRSQAYPIWELCIADDASPAPHVRRVLSEYAAVDSRIKVTFRETNGHISAASNSALDLVSGEYIALLDHDDELPPHALFEIAMAIQAHPEWRLIYSDEDKIDEKGQRFAPYFKPDWNYELFLSQNCICHLGVYHAALLREIGGFRVGMEGSQDWDLALRCIERLTRDEIGHIPKVLYHWRAIEGSTALGVGQKDYARNAGMQAVSDHLRRTGIDARVDVAESGYLRIHRSLPAAPPRVSLIIPTRDKVDLLRVCVQSILEKTQYPDYEILVVDNQSQEQETLDYFAELAGIPNVSVLHYGAPFNYSAINNFAASKASGAIIGLVNNDIEVISPEWLAEMVSHAVRGEVGAVGTLLLYPDNTVQHAGVILGIGGIAGHAHVGLPADAAGSSSRLRLCQELSAVTAACLLVRKEVFDKVGGLDEGLSVAFNDIDFCMRVRAAGYLNIWTPHARLYHHESASRGYEDTPEKLLRFRGETEFMRKRWGSGLLNDPAYNPNLTLEGTPYELAFPPRSSGSL